MSGIKTTIWLSICLAGTLLAATAAGVPVVQFHADTRGGRDAARRCAEIWAAEGPALAAALLGAGAPADTVHCLVLDTAAFEQRFAARLPDWGVGVALGPQAVALDYSRLPAVGRGLHEIFLHEMVHALLFQGSGGAPLPAWFHEGCAMRLAGEWRFTDTVSLVMAGRVPDLSRLQGRWPSLPQPADRAYRTSLLAVDRLVDRHGEGILGGILAGTRRTGSFATGFQEAAGQPLEDFYADFASAMRLRFGWLTLMTSWPGLFVLLALLLFVGGTVKLVCARRRLARLDDDHSFPPR